METENYETFRVELNKLMEEDALAQFEYEHEYFRRDLDEYQQLWLEVLKQAICDYIELWPKRNQQIADFNEIYNWFFKEIGLRMGSFNYICMALDITKYTIMQPLVEYSKKHV